MKNIRQLLMGLPMFNIIAVVACWSLHTLEMHFNPVTENSAPITVVGAVWLLLIMGGFAACGLIYGVLRTVKYKYRLKEIAVQIILLSLIIELIYIVFYFLSQNSHAFILRDTSIITLEQISGYLAGCCIGTLINMLLKKSRS